ncbi:MAG: hypothetical protein M3063_03150 [Actinomycetota bacterium]|nr:hypothetical protein [Actinomycetota bacterium]
MRVAVRRRRASDPRPWTVEQAAGPAAELHESSAALIATATSEVVRVIRILEVQHPTVVLGSGQPEHHVDRARAAALGVAVARRRSGGAAVLVGPGEVLWIDVVVPADDPLWSADLRRAGWWLGGCWAAALADIGIAGVETWRGGMVSGPWAAKVCFAGLGPGEVTVEGAKVVGICQRRTRAATLFQCAMPLSKRLGRPIGPWDPTGLLDVLSLSAGERQQGGIDLASVAVAVSDGTALRDALIARCAEAGLG